MIIFICVLVRMLNLLFNAKLTLFYYISNYLEYLPNRWINFCIDIFTTITIEIKV